MYWYLKLFCGEIDAAIGQRLDAEVAKVAQSPLKVGRSGGHHRVAAGRCAPDQPSHHVAVDFGDFVEDTVALVLEDDAQQQARQWAGRQVAAAPAGAVQQRLPRTRSSPLLLSTNHILLPWSIF